MGAEGVDAIVDVDTRATKIQDMITNLIASIGAEHDAAPRGAIGGEPGRGRDLHPHRHRARHRPQGVLVAPSPPATRPS